MAVALTEGIVAAIVNQNASAAASGNTDKILRYCGQYVQSPLRWMIVTGAGRGITSFADIRALLDTSEDAPGPDGTAPAPRQIRVSVSRLGSGSHLMAYLLATRQGWPADRLTFTVDRDFRSMRRAVCEGSSDLFMWEWFMTKPFVDAHELGVLGFIDTPWPCFGLVARQAWLGEPGNARMLSEVMRIVQAHARAFAGAEDESCDQICATFGLDLADAHAWMASVRYAPDLSAPRPMLRGVLRVLASVGVITLPPQSPKARGDGPPGDALPTAVLQGYLEAHIVETAVCPLTGPDADAPEAAATAAGDESGVAADSGSTADGAEHGDEEAHVSTGSTIKRSPSDDLFTLPARGSPAAVPGARVAGVVRSRSNSLCSTGSSNALTAAKAAAAAIAAIKAGAFGGSSVAGSTSPVPRVGAASSVGAPTRGEGMWHLKSGDALPLTAGAGGAAERRGHKASALADVLAHLSRFGGAVVQDTQTEKPSSVSFADAPGLVAERLRQIRKDSAPASPAVPRTRSGGRARDAFETGAGGDGGTHDDVALPLPSGFSFSGDVDGRAPDPVRGGSGLGDAQGLLGPSGGIPAVPAPGRARRNSRIYAPGAGWDGKDDWLIDIG